MNSVTKAGLRAMRRHPRKAMRVSLFALRHRTAVTRGVRAARFASQLATTAKRGADDPKVKTEARAAITALAAAFGDARRAGVTKLGRDDQVAARLRQARNHASNTASAVRSPAPRRRGVLRGGATHLARASAVGAAGYGAWKTFSRCRKS